jgi:hypothetical protein
MVMDVPDYKDKELLTPQKCFPVDADGVGNCPEPACCTELRNRIDSGLVGGGNCGLGNCQVYNLGQEVGLCQEMRCLFLLVLQPKLKKVPIAELE